MVKNLQSLNFPCSSHLRARKSFDAAKACYGSLLQSYLYEISEKSRFGELCGAARAGFDEKAEKTKKNVLLRRRIAPKSAFSTNSQIKMKRGDPYVTFGLSYDAVSRKINSQ